MQDKTESAKGYNGPKVDHVAMEKMKVDHSEIDDRSLKTKRVSPTPGLRLDHAVQHQKDVRRNLSIRAASPSCAMKCSPP
jgi:hypothetical protein